MFKHLLKSAQTCHGIRPLSTTVPVGGLSSYQETLEALPPAVKKLLEDFPSLITIGVQWGQMDSYGHVNNVHYMRYFESGRIAYFDQVVGPHLNETDYTNFITGKKVGPILKSAAIKYIAPVVYPDTLTATLGEDRFTQDFVAVSHKMQRVVANGKAEVVTFDYVNQKKAPIPSEVLAAFRKGDLERQ
ncbi:hypothetical protein HK101_004858 [Irineochytrium annulatum]|nr:hypothetical protein HK101_004858 [Irineochytrium annulatum]